MLRWFSSELIFGDLYDGSRRPWPPLPASTTVRLRRSHHLASPSVARAIPPAGHCRGPRGPKLALRARAVSRPVRRANFQIFGECSPAAHNRLERFVHASRTNRARRSVKFGGGDVSRLPPSRSRSTAEFSACNSYASSFTLLG
jgi:hypothetical protein